MNRHPILILLALFTLLLTACTPISRPEQPASQTSLPLSANSTIGQTFVANFAGLNGIEIYLTPQILANGEITLHLRESPDSDRDLVRVTLPVNSVTAPGYYRFRFPPQFDSTRKTYYAFWRASDSLDMQARAAAGSVYLDGSAYQFHTPLPDSQLTFNLTYDPPRLALGLMREGLTWLWYLLITAWLLLLPGGALLHAFYPAARDLPRLSQSALAVGVGLALYPVLFVWTDLLHWHWGLGYALVPGLAGAAYWGVWMYRERGVLRSDVMRNDGMRNAVADAALLLVLAVVILTRFWVVRNLEGPLWGDGMQHTLIVQLLLDNGGLFQSWQPYAPIQTFTYHFGFHAVSAAFAWLTGLEARFATLWMGQILNVLAVFTLIPLANWLSGGKRWAGVLAVLVAGLISPMPMFYLNWGRYTQLAGQAILPVVVMLTWRWLDEPFRLSRRQLMLGALLWAGLGLAHYRVLIFGILALLAWWLAAEKRALHLLALRNSLLLGAAGGILFLPWFVRVWGGQILVLFGNQLSTPAASISEFTQQYNGLGDVRVFLPYLVWILMAIAAARLLWQRNSSVGVLLIWAGLLFLGANPRWLNLPGEGALSNFAVFLMAYLFAAVLIGAWLAQFALGRFSRWGAAALLLFTLGLGMYAAPLRIREIDPLSHALLTRADVRAGEWLAQNTPPEAKFFVNSFGAYVNARVGSDGGWWLPLTAHRQPSVRPLSGGFEQPIPLAVREQSARLADLLQTQGAVDAPETLSLLHTLGCDYIYIGQRQGRVNFSGVTLNPLALLASDAYALVYHQDGVWVFRVEAQR
ncbi:MAG: hypothetical protein OHK0052_06790 [Anaerolineales bacterium]